MVKNMERKVINEEDFKISGLRVHIGIGVPDVSLIIEPSDLLKWKRYGIKRAGKKR